VGSGSAVVRTTQDNDRNKNAVGIVVKKNAYTAEGKYTNEDKD